MPNLWPTATIRELLCTAEAIGEAKATLSSNRDAKLFRYAIYSFRKATAIGQNVSVTIDDRTVIVRKRDEPFVTLHQELQQQEA